MCRAVLIFIAFNSYLLFSSAQCLDLDAHNTSISSQWLSCQMSDSPIPGLPRSHWIMYEFDAPVGVEGMEIWNLNHPDFANMGARDIRIDYSIDGASWNTLGTIEIARAAGDPFSMAEEIEDLEKFDAQYVLLTILNNYGGDCSGLAEVKFQLGALTTSNKEIVTNELKIWPNPADQEVRIDLGEWKGKVSRYQVMDQLGRIVVSNNTSDKGIIQISTADLAAGQYVVSFRGQETIVNQSMVIIHPD